MDLSMATFYPIEEPEAEENPGAILMRDLGMTSTSKYPDWRFDQLPNEYVNQILNQYREDDIGSQRLPEYWVNFVETHHRYLEWVQNLAKTEFSPGSIIIWFGPRDGRTYYGQEFRVLYQDESYWNWLIGSQPNTDYSKRLLQIEKEWWEFQLNHREEEKRLSEDIYYDNRARRYRKRNPASRQVYLYYVDDSTYANLQEAKRIKREVDARAKVARANQIKMETVELPIVAEYIPPDEDALANDMEGQVESASLAGSINAENIVQEDAREKDAAEVRTESVIVDDLISFEDIKREDAEVKEITESPTESEMEVTVDAEHIKREEDTKVKEITGIQIEDEVNQGTIHVDEDEAHANDPTFHPIESGTDGVTINANEEEAYAKDTAENQIKSETDSNVIDAEHIERKEIQENNLIESQAKIEMAEITADTDEEQAQAENLTENQIKSETDDSMVDDEHIEREEETKAQDLIENQSKSDTEDHVIDAVGIEIDQTSIQQGDEMTPELESTQASTASPESLASSTRLSPNESVSTAPSLEAVSTRLEIKEKASADPLVVDASVDNPPTKIHQLTKEVAKELSEESPRQHSTVVGTGKPKGRSFRRLLRSLLCGSK